ncbi:MAG: CoA pyrophosphatase, partial [Gemmatimonadaceae bacterium]
MKSLSALRSHTQIQQLASAIAERDCIEVHDDVARRAGVAILIRVGADHSLELFFIQRAEYEGDPWSGQIAFPGGREEPGDATLYDTAARETREETGIDITARGELLGALDDLTPDTMRLPAVIVRPFVVLLADAGEPVLSDEVANCFWVPLPLLMDRSVWRNTTVAAGGQEMSRFAFHHEGYVVWGMTERILSGLLSLMP